MLLAPEELRQFQNHSSQMAALDFMVSVASNTFIPTYDGNMAKLVEGHRRYVDALTKQSYLLNNKTVLYNCRIFRTLLINIYHRYLGFKRTILLDRRKIVELVDMHQNGTLSWNDFAVAVQLAHEKRMGQPSHRSVIAEKPKEEDYFYANPQECLCEGTSCDDLLSLGNSTKHG